MPAKTQAKANGSARKAAARKRTEADEHRIADDDDALPLEQVTDISNDPPTPESMLAEFFGQDFTEPVSCSVYELGGPTKKERSYICGFDLDESMSLRELFDDLLAEYGPGKYELQAQGEGGRMITRKLFQLGSSKQPKAGRAIINPARRSDDQAESPRERGGATSEIAAVLGAFMEGQNKILERLVDAQAEARAPTAGRFDAIREFMELQQLFGPKEQTPMSEMTAMFRDMLKLKDQIAGASDDDSPFGTAMKQLGPMLERFMARYGDAPASQAPATAARIPPAPLNEAPPSPPSMSGTNLMNLDALFGQLRQLAEQNVAPDQAGTQVFATLTEQPDWIENLVLDLVFEERDAVVSRLIAMHPPLAPHREWLTGTVRFMVHSLEQAEAAEDAAQQPQPPEQTDHAKSPADSAP